MMAPLLWIAAALATEPAEYAQRAELDLPASGAVLIDLDEAQLWPGRDDLLLLDAEGRQVPYVRLGSWQPQQGGCERVPWDPVGPPPRYDTIRVDTRRLGRVVDTLIVDPGAVGGGLFAGSARLVSLGDGAFALPIEVLEDGKVVAEGLLWRANIAHADRENYRVQVPDLAPGLYELRAPTPLRWQGVQACWTAQTDIEPVTLSLEVEGPEEAHEGRSRYTLALPAAGLELIDLELDIEDPRFDRSVSLEAPAYDMTGERGRALVTGDIERLSLGGATIDHVGVEVNREVSDRLVLSVDDQRDAPLSITGATARLRNRQLLVTDAGPGPHVLYAAPSSPTRATYDLDHAVVELLRENPPRVRPARWVSNPDFNPAERMPEALLQGAEAQLSGYRASREASAPRPGVPTRWILPDEVVRRSRSDLGDLRLVDSEGHQVPYVVERMGLREIGVKDENDEAEGRTRLRIQLDAPARAELIVLRTSTEVYQRTVRVEGGSTVSWQRDLDGAPRPLAVRLDGEVRERVLITIDNGDDKALSDLTVQVFVPDVAIVAAAPSGLAKLWYGNPQVMAPDYDLRLLTDRLLNGVVEQGGLGPGVVEELSSEQDRRLGLLAVGALAVALVLLVLRLLKDPAPAES
ncbi:MAG: hypothetical protein H6741_15820 [Alphaproteobacteria bacterium]|nr:hypothetical protein [Alphaproteobacteria bacterium]